jgi:type III secretion protein C
MTPPIALDQQFLYRFLRQCLYRFIRRALLIARRSVLLPMLVALLVAMFLSTAAIAVPIKWKSQAFRYEANGKDIKEVLQDFGASQGMAVSVSRDLQGSVVGKFVLGPPQFMDLLAMSYGFFYYFNGVVLHVSSATAVRTTMVGLTSATIKDLRETLAQLRMIEPRFPIQYDEAANTALVSGPPEYVDAVRETADQLERRAQRKGGAVVRVFPLTFAWAVDRASATGAIQPGVVSILQATYGRGAGGGIGAGAGVGTGAGPADIAAAVGNAGVNGDGDGVSKVAPLIGKSGTASGSDASSLGWLGLDSGASAALAKTTSTFVRSPKRSNDGAGTGARDSANPGQSADSNLPIIVADAGNNSVIVRDYPERLTAYESLIKTIDVPPRMIEIEVQVLDIEEGAMSDLGVEWGSTGVGRGASGLSALPAIAAGVPPVAAALTTVLGNAGRNLLNRVVALSQQGRARINSRPKVATLNNVPAFMRNEQTFYVKVAGYQSGTLNSVSAGMSLRVTPMAVPGAGGRRIKLDVHVDDGDISTTQMVDNLPVVTRTQLETQAFVNEGESLLLAGYVVERSSNSTSAVPLLSDIPLLGAAFKRTTTSSSRVDRLFLVTPRVME